MLYVSIDWIEWTTFAFDSVYPVKEGFTENYFSALDCLLDVLHYNKEEFFLCDRAKYGYGCMLKHYEVPFLILYSGRKDMGMHISLSGKAVDHLVKRLGKTENETIEYLRQYGKFTRIDIAIDDIDAEYFTVPKIRQHLKKGEYRTRFRNYSFIKMYSANSGTSDAIDASLSPPAAEGRATESNHPEKNDKKLTQKDGRVAASGDRKEGDTIYLGRRSSGSFIRIYDKKLEHNFKLPDEDPIRNEWTRWELELKSDNANNAADLICKYHDIRSPAAAILRSCFEIVELDDIRKTRCSVNRKYEKMLQSVPAAKISKSKKILTVDEKMQWLRNQCAKSMALSQAADPEFLQNCTEYGFQLLSDDELNTLINRGN